MTNKEAIKQLLAIKKLGCLSDEDRQSINLAIKALEFINENCPCDDCEEQYDCGDCDYRYRGE